MHTDDQSWRSELTRRGTLRQRRPKQLVLKSDEDFLLERVEFDTNGGCWLWTGVVSAGGYGISNRGAAHRLAYRTFVGNPRDKLVCHTCDVRSCANPAHLWLGTHKDNSDDMMKKKRGAWEEKKPEHLSFWQNGDNNPTTKLSSSLAKEIRESSKSVRELSIQYGVSRSTIQRILARTIWKV
jgi:hypothetical protein